MGALKPERLATLKQRMADMPCEPGCDPPFLYGSHYSCPGFVMFWLVRAAPGHLLRWSPLAGEVSVQSLCTEYWRTSR